MELALLDAVKWLLVLIAACSAARPRRFDSWDQTLPHPPSLPGGAPPALTTHSTERPFETTAVLCLVEPSGEPFTCNLQMSGLLYVAAISGSVERMTALLSSGSIDVDKVDEKPPHCTALMFASQSGHSMVVRILLNKGADVSIVADGGITALHLAARHGDRATTKLLTDAGADLEVSCRSGGYTPLHVAAIYGRSDAMRVLIEAGANPNSRGLDKSTPLCMAADHGHLDAVKVLVKAGADLEGLATAIGYRPLHFAARGGHSEVMSALIEAGANPNSRSFDGATPLLLVADKGYLDAVKVLHGAKADPLLAWTCDGLTFLPLDKAVNGGHWEVVRELIQHGGCKIEGCGGASRGVHALGMAAMRQDVGVMAMLTEAGVVDTYIALTCAIRYGKEVSVKFLLQQQGKGNASRKLAVYVNARDEHGRPPLVSCIMCSPSPRIVRLLIDAGADAASAVRATNTEGKAVFDTPLTLTTVYLREKKIQGKDATEKQLHRLDGVRRLLLRVQAVYAVSWAWPDDSRVSAGAAAGERRMTTTSAPLSAMMPILRRRVARGGVLRAAMFR